MPHVFRVYPGGHEQSVWSAHARAWLSVAVDHLARWSVGSGYAFVKRQVPPLLEEEMRTVAAGNGAPCGVAVGGAGLEAASPAAGGGAGAGDDVGGGSHVNP